MAKRRITRRVSRRRPLTPEEEERLKLFGVILSAVFGMPLKHAILGSAIFLVYKVLVVFAFAALLSPT